MAQILYVNGLSVKLDNNSILENISFALNENDTLAVIGPNGSGKTMLLKALFGMVPHSGKIEWAPNVKIGYVPQKIEADRHLPVTFSNLLESKANILKLPKRELLSIYSSVGLTSELLDTPVGHLSGGEFQRGLIAFAMLGEPQILLFDEPTASIDVPGGEQMYELIHRMQDAYQIAVILVSHDLSFVYRFANKVLCLNRQNLCFGQPQDVLTPQVLKKLYGTDMKYFHHHHH